MKTCYFCRTDPGPWWRLATETLSQLVSHPTEPQKWICGICHPPSISDVEWMPDESAEQNDNPGGVYGID